MGLRTIGINGVNLSFPDDLVLVWDDSGIWLSYAPPTAAEQALTAFHQARLAPPPAVAPSWHQGRRPGTPGPPQAPARTVRPEDVTPDVVRSILAGDDSVVIADDDDEAPPDLPAPFRADKPGRGRPRRGAITRHLPDDIDARIDAAIVSHGGAISARALWQAIFGAGTAAENGNLDTKLRLRMAERVARGDLIYLRKGVGQRGVMSIYGFAGPAPVTPAVKHRDENGETGLTGPAGMTPADEDAPHERAD